MYAVSVLFMDYLNIALIFSYVIQIICKSIIKVEITFSILFK
jgi:hypothetical protein